MYVLSSLLYVSQSSFHVPTQLSTNASLMETQFNFHNYHKEKEKLLRAIPLLLFSRGRASIWELWLKILCVLKAWQFAIATNFREGRKREKKRQWFFLLSLFTCNKLKFLMWHRQSFWDMNRYEKLSKKNCWRSWGSQKKSQIAFPAHS